MRLAAVTGVATLAAAGIVAAAAHEIPLNERRSDTTFVGADTRAMQDDDSSNPGMLAVLDGQALWRQKSSAVGKSCADCHGEAEASMKGVAARYPAFMPSLGRPVDLQQRINMSRVADQKAPAWPLESRELLALTTYVARQSRGLAIAVVADASSQPFIAAGRAIFEARQGQLNIACAQCHDDDWGKRLAGNLVPQAQPTGYPVYRLQWQEVGSLQRRLRDCMTAMRAEPYDYGSPELVDLEFYLMWRGRGLKMETPAVRP
jgi:sulfur-oxidizing protein SoxA